MAAKDVQAREKALSVEARHAALVGRTGTVEATVSTLQHTKTDKASISHPAGRTCTSGFSGTGVNNGLPGATGVATDLNAIAADIGNLYTAVNALITAMNA
jgi:hypothetical protein